MVVKSIGSLAALPGLKSPLSHYLCDSGQATCYGLNSAFPTPHSSYVKFLIHRTPESDCIWR